MNKHISIFVTDIHGSMRTLKAAMRTAHEEGAKSLIIGGDICPKKPVVKLKDGKCLNPEALKGSSLLEKANETVRENKPIADLNIPAYSPDESSLMIELKNENIRLELLEWQLRMVARSERGYPFLGQKLTRQDFAHLREVVLPEIRSRVARWVNKQVGDKRVIDRLMGKVHTKKEPEAMKIFDTVIFNLILMGELKKIMSRKLAGICTIINETAEDYRKISAAQTKWVREVLSSSLREFASSTGIKVFVMPGNDDVKAVLGALEKGQNKLVRQVHNKVEPLGDGFFIAGYSFVPWLSDSIIVRDWVKNEGGMAEDLYKIAGNIDPKKLVLSTHAPPCGVPFSRFFIGPDEADGGSVAVREFIERKTPLLTLHGHIHEAPSRTGIWKVSFADGSTSINPGALHNTGAEIAIFDLLDVAGSIKRIKLEKGGH